MSEPTDKKQVNETVSSPATKLFNPADRHNARIAAINAQQVPGKPNNDLRVEPSQDTAISQNQDFSTFAAYRANIEKIIDSNAILSLNNPGISRSAYFASSMDVLDEERYLPLVTDKVARLNQYRIISEYPECAWCIREICSDFLTIDNQGEFIKVKISQSKQKQLTDSQIEVIEDEFKRLISVFDIKNNIYDYVSTFLVEGELAFENIIHHDTPTLGIVAVKKIRNDFYDLLIDKETGNNCGIYFDLDKYATELQYSLSPFYNQSSQIFNTMYASGYRGISLATSQNIVPLLWPQVTYISFDHKSPDGRMCFSAVEDVKQAYYQLVLLQDAAVILRVTRAPQRLLFNIATGGMNDRDGDDIIRRFAQSLKARKVAKPDFQHKNGSIIGNSYNPSTMLESWIFKKTTANDGTTVDTVASTSNYSEIDDLKYFLRRFIKQWGVAYSRYDQDKEPSAVRASTEISQEEFAMAKMILHYQMLFAKPLKSTFITHLKLREIWNKYKLSESDIDVEFIPPYVYNRFISQQEITQKMETYGKFAERDEFSKTWAMKEHLGMSDADITTNNKLFLLDKIIESWGEAIPEKFNEEGLSKDLQNALLSANLASLEDLFKEKLAGAFKSKDEDEEGDEDEGGGGGDEDMGDMDFGGGDEGGGDEGGGDEGGGEEPPM